MHYYLKWKIRGSQPCSSRPDSPPSPLTCLGRPLGLSRVFLRQVLPNDTPCRRRPLLPGALPQTTWGNLLTPIELVPEVLERRQTHAEFCVFGLRGVRMLGNYLEGYLLRITLVLLQ